MLHKKVNDGTFEKMATWNDEDSLLFCVPTLACFVPMLPVTEEVNLVLRCYRMTAEHPLSEGESQFSSNAVIDVPLPIFLHNYSCGITATIPKQQYPRRK